jgi:hypothetical protein
MRVHEALIRLADAVAGGLGMRDCPFDADRLIAAAARASRSPAREVEQIRPALDQFLDACATEAELNVLGRAVTRWDAVRLLGNLFRLAAEERRAPEILDERIERPLFVTGVPRSGTTFLHRLLTQDRTNMVPRIWQVLYPYPSRGHRGPDTRRARVQRHLNMFEFVAPGFRDLHPADADAPQECSEINAHVFASLRFDTTYNVPSYRRWLDASGHAGAYAFQKRFLQHLQHQTRRESDEARRWVLKCPDHVFALDALREAYPDAGVVFVHRDPVRVLASNARLTETVRRPFTRRVDRAALGAQESARWLHGTSEMIRADRAGAFNRPIFHIRHADLIADPINTVRALYWHFDMTLAPETEARIARQVLREPHGGYGGTRARLEDFGLDADAERFKFSGYVARFGIAAEQRDRSGPTPTPASPVRNDGFARLRA